MVTFAAAIQELTQKGWISTNGASFLRRLAAGKSAAALPATP